MTIEIERLKHQLQNCAGWGGDELSTQRQDALDYYFQRPRGDEIPGRSRAVAGTISSMVEATLAQAIAALSSDNVIEIDPTGPEDEDQAQLESDALIHFVMKQDPGFVNLGFAIKDCVLLRNGVMKVWCETETDTRSRTLENVELETLAMLPQEIRVMHYDPDKKSARIKRTQKTNRFRSESVALENFFYPKTWDSYDMQRSPFCAERHVEARHELIRRGFPKRLVNSLRPHSVNSSGNTLVDSRNPGMFSDPPSEGMDASTDQIEWYECYVIADGERRRISMSYAESVILEDDPVDIVPYAVGAALLNPHRLTGISMYDKLRQNQDIETGLTRALLDGVNTVNKNRIAYLDGKVNPDDVNDGRTNGALRVTGVGITDVRQAITPMVVPDQSAGLLANLQYQKTVRNETGGAALELASGEAQLGDKMGSQGLDRAYSVMEQLSAMMMQHIAATLIRSLFLIAHATLRDRYDQPINLKRNGAWQSTNPAEWQPRESLTVKLGKSPGERARRSAALSTLLGYQVQLAQLGMDEVLVDVHGFYRAITDWARINEIPNPEQYLIDPRSEESVTAAQSKARMAQAEAQKREALMSEAVGTEKFRAMIDKYKADQETQFKYWNAVLASEIAEAKIVGDATKDLLTARGRPNGADEAKPNEPVTSD